MKKMKTKTDIFCKTISLIWNQYILWS